MMSETRDNGTIMNNATVDIEANRSAVLCDMLGCREHATGEVQVGDEYIPMCEQHRQVETERLMPKWRPLPPHQPNADAVARRAKD